MVTVPLPGPVLLMARLNWEIPCWLTVKVCPATVIVPVLDEVPELAATE